MHLVDCFRPVANRAHGHRTVDCLDDASGPNGPEPSTQLDQLHSLAHQAARDLDAFLGPLHPTVRHLPVSTTLTSPPAALPAAV